MEKKIIDDEDFVTAIKEFVKGNESFFPVIFQKTRQPLHLFALLMVKDEDRAAELLKEAYLRIAESVNSLRDPGNFGIWAKRIMHNMVLFKYGMERANGASGSDYDALMEKLEKERNDDSTTKDADDEALSRLLIKLIFGLSMEERIALVSFYHGRMMLNDIAVMMDCDRAQIKALIFSARGKIREQLGEYEKENHLQIRSIAPYITAGIRMFEKVHPFPEELKKEIYDEIERLIERQQHLRNNIDSQRSSRGRSESIRFANRRTMIIIIAIAAVIAAFLIGHRL